MRDGFRAYDADTHVNPAADVLDRYVDPAFRPRLAELAPHKVPSGQMVGGTPDTHQYRAQASRTIRPPTGSPTWTTKAPTRISSSPRCGSAWSVCRTPTSRST